MRKSLREDQYYYCMVHSVKDYGTVATIHHICTKLGTEEYFLEIAALACEGAMTISFLKSTILCLVSCSNTRLSKNAKGSAH